MAEPTSQFFKPYSCQIISFLIRNYMVSETSAVGARLFLLLATTTRSKEFSNVRMAGFRELRE